MSAARLSHRQGEGAVPALSDTPLGAPSASEARLAGLSNLATLAIETALVADLSGELHALFDPVSEGVLPIYFGPLLGRLYLEGL